jgi:hypothetical protein
MKSCDKICRSLYTESENAIKPFLLVRLYVRAEARTLQTETLREQQIPYGDNRKKNKTRNLDLVLGFLPAQV